MAGGRPQGEVTQAADRSRCPALDVMEGQGERQGPGLPLHGRVVPGTAPRTDPAARTADPFPRSECQSPHALKLASPVRLVGDELAQTSQPKQALVALRVDVYL